MEKDSAVIQNTNYKLLDLMKFICAFLVIGIHTRPFQVVSDVADKLFYYDISNYAVATVYKGNIIKNLIMDCQSYTKYRPNETIMELAIYLLKL